MSYVTPTKLKRVLKRGDDINIFISDRNGRKSSTGQDFFINEAKRGRPFALLRSKKDEFINDKWLSEHIINKYSDYTFYTENVNSNIAALYFNDENDSRYLLCYGLFLSLAEKYKSNYYDGFEKVKYILWEECIPNKPIQQSARFIARSLMEQIKSVLSIGSTITRGNKPQYIFFGNDISINLLNPVTVCFNLLERLEKDVEIEDTAIIDDRQYTFYFNYFSFPNSVEHWLYNKELQIDNNVKITTENIKYPFILLSEFKQYFLYDMGSYIYISDKNIAQPPKNKTYNDIGELFAKYNAGHLLAGYPLPTALIMLETLYNCPKYELVNYFGKDYKRTQKPEFKPLTESVNENRVINVYELFNMNLSAVLNSPNYSDILTLNDLLKKSTVIYSNIQIKMLLDDLRDKLLFLS